MKARFRGRVYILYCRAAMAVAAEGTECWARRGVVQGTFSATLRARFVPDERRIRRGLRRFSEEDRQAALGVEEHEFEPRRSRGLPGAATWREFGG